MSEKRLVKVKKKILADILAGLSKAPGLIPENVKKLFQQDFGLIECGECKTAHTNKKGDYHV